MILPRVRKSQYEKVNEIHINLQGLVSVILPISYQKWKETDILVVVERPVQPIESVVHFGTE